MRFALTALLAISLAACDESGTQIDPLLPRSDMGAPDASPDAQSDAAAATTCQTHQIYDPLADPEPATFPDDLLLSKDDSTLTGWRLELTTENAPWIEAAPGGYGLLYEQMATLDGFGTSAPVFFRFDAPITSIEAVVDGIRLVDLGDDVAVDVPYEPIMLEGGRTLALWPIFPLRPATRHGVIAVDLLDAEGGCVEPAPLLSDLLNGTANGPFERLNSRYTELLKKADIDVESVVAATVFTTQSVTESSEAIAAKIRGMEFEWDADRRCVSSATQKQCTGEFMASDFRDADGIAQLEPQQTYQLPVSIWMPTEGEGPWPVVFAGHGLGGDRSLGGSIRAGLNAEVVVVSIDAVNHGTHPGGHSEGQVNRIMDFFEIELAKQRINGLALRDNFRQSTFDKLQVIELLRQNPDLDGDGNPDVDLSRMAYFGVSLGGIMGSEFLALTDTIGAGVLGIAGARLTQIIRDGSMFKALIPLLIPRTNDAGIQRIFGALQTLLERGDPINFAPHIIDHRLPIGGETPTQILMVMAIDDQVVSNSATLSLARAIGVPQLKPIINAYGYLPEAIDAPASGNVAGGQASAGLFQYDLITQPGIGGTIRTLKAAHEIVMGSREALYQFQQFHRTWLTDGVSKLVNPFSRFGQPHLRER